MTGSRATGWNHCLVRTIGIVLMLIVFLSWLKSLTWSHLCSKSLWGEIHLWDWNMKHNVTHRNQQPNTTLLWRSCINLHVTDIKRFSHTHQSLQYSMFSYLPWIVHPKFHVTLPWDHGLIKWQFLLFIIFKQGITIVFKITCKWRRMQTHRTNTILSVSHNQLTASRLLVIDNVVLGLWVCFLHFFS
jgi:hypothetical protein